MAEAGKERRPKILLITDNKSVLLEMGSDGKFSAKSAPWEEIKVVLEGEELVILVEGGRWFIEKRPAPLPLVGPGAIAAPATRLSATSLHGVAGAAVLAV
jgi:hypothetical protein